MEESISLKRFGIDAFSLLDQIFQKYPNLPETVVNISYDREADVLYVDFTLEGKAVDSEPLNESSMIIAGLDPQGAITSLTIMNASSLAHNLAF
ncbi:MAG: DUF2283 domain-containing protein [Candidatus Hodarchaeales archaeon]|jgi:uncharacterized protein YuzE